MSADSGVSTFRDAGGLWEQHRIEDVCTAEAWERNPALVLDFYNARRKQLDRVEPNAGHHAIKRLEEHFDVQVVTQNVDDLHERAGSSHVLHLHGELRKVRSTADPSLVSTLDGWELKMGDRCEKGSQLRPHIVFFGESVPNYDKAVELVSLADILIVVGTSLNVYPAAQLVYYCAPPSPVYVVDPSDVRVGGFGGRINYIRERSAVGLPALVEELIKNK